MDYLKISLIIGLGISIRLFMFFSTKSLWGDEWFSLGLIQNPMVEVIKGSINDIHPPLYFILLKSITWLLGEREFGLRFLSIIASIGTLIGTYELGKETFERKVGYLAAFFVAISPCLLQSSNEIRSYSLLTCFVTWGTVFFFKYLDAPKKIVYGILYGVLSVLAIYTEHLAWFWVIGLIVCLFFAEKDNRSKTFLSTVGKYILILGIPILILIIYQSIFREGVFDVGRMIQYRIEYGSIPILFKKIVGIFWHFTCGYQYSMITMEFIRGALYSPLFIFSGILTFLFTWNLFKGLNLFGLVVIVFPILFLFAFYPIRLEARYLSFLIPMCFVIISSQIYDKKFLIGLFVIVNIVGSIYAINLKTDVIHKEDYHGLVKYVYTYGSKDDVVVGLEPQVNYYRINGGPVYYFQDLESFLKSPNTYFTVWVLSPINMHQSVTDRIHNDIRLKMKGVGYEPLEAPIRFGGKSGLASVYRFHRMV